jgi:hypothetical protein
VPDFSSGPLALSGIMIAVIPGAAVASPDKFVGLLPVTPTSQREFKHGEQVSAFARVYQRGKAPVARVEMTVSVIDAAGQIVVDHHEMLDPDQFGGDRAADFGFALPIARMAPGRHLLAITASGGGVSTVRQVPFGVR